MSSLQQAIQLAKNGQGDRALIILRDLVQRNDEDLYAWLWLAEVSPDIDEARYAAQQVLKLRPTNTRAQQILSNLGDDEDTPHDWMPAWLHSKVKREGSEPTWRNISPLIAIVAGALLLLAGAFWLLTDFPNDVPLDGGVTGEVGQKSPTQALSDTDEAALSGDAQAEESGSLAKVAVFRDGEFYASADNLPDDPEALTINWLREVVAGERPLDLSLSCNGEESGGLQQTLEPFLARLLEYGVTNALRALQVDAVFSTLEVVDGTARYQIDGRIQVTVLGHTLESPPFSTVVRFVSQQGQWVLCEVAR